MTVFFSDSDLAPSSSDRPATRSPTRPQVSIAIVTRDRKDELRDAVRSALAQRGSIEVVVVDDGSEDGTPEMIRTEFPDVRLVRFDEPAGLATRRNDATTASAGDVIVSIDDDAVFTSEDIVARTLEDFDHPRIGAVAMPYIDVGVSSVVHQRAPEPTDRWATSVFRGTAYALRREVLVELGGFRAAIYHQGEDWDLSLRMLDAGYLIRLGRAEPIHHRASPRRSLRKMDLYGRRNELLISWTYFPTPWNVVYLAGYAYKGMLLGFREGRPAVMARGIIGGLIECWSNRGARRPIRRAAFRVDRRARANGSLSFAEVEAELGPLGPPPIEPGGSWPAAVRRLHLPLRRLRTRVLAGAGRPVRCEVCGAVLFRGFPFIWRGRLNLFGAEAALVRADWDKMNRLTFRHVERSQCRAK